MIRSLNLKYCNYITKNIYLCSTVKTIENKWQRLWLQQKTRSFNRSHKFYCLSQFPYPSGNLHMGHARVYFISDIISRYQTLRCKSVIHPIGWDSFGLPAQNAAIQRNIQPSIWTENNIAQMKGQMIRLGLKFNWELELATHLPNYYKWTQKIFLDLYNKGLAYKKEAQVNWDPIDKTVLANQQVDIHGNSWRSGAKVEKKKLNQWFFKITSMAKELQQSLNTLNWPEKVKQMQKGWIGRKQGHIVKFLINEHINKQLIGQYINVFTTRIQTIMGCTFVVTSTLSKHGNKIGKCIHPITNEQLIILQADYVLKEYGTGNVMGVPSHNQKDRQFAQQNNLQFKQVLKKRIQNNSQIQYLINSGIFNKCTIQEARIQIFSYLEKKDLIQQQTTLHIKDWLVSRQRYWGCPIPIVYCQMCGVQPVHESQLPVILPSSDMSKGNPLYDQKYKKTICPKCKSQATRQTDTLDTFVDSSWYYLRYLDNQNHKQIFSKIKAQKYLPVDVYIGGIQHAIMHLLYARFIHKFLYNQSLIPIHQQPFKELIVQGLVKGRTFQLKSNGKYLKKQQLEKYKPQDISQSFEKMSKSKFNGISPIEIVQKYGSDALRLSLMFSTPLEKDLEYKQEETERSLNFLKKIMSLRQKIQEYVQKQPSSSTFQSQTFEKLLKITEEIEISLQKNYSLHVYCARIMEISNLLQSLLKTVKLNKQYIHLIYTFLIIVMKPIAPHISSQIISSLQLNQFQKQIFLQDGEISWPKIQILRSKFLDQDLIDVKISINNKFQTILKIKELDIMKDESLLAACSDCKDIKKFEVDKISKIIKQKNSKGFIVNILMQKR